MALALSFGLVSTFSSCASSQKYTNSKNTLPKINMSKWLYNADDDVYYQLGLEYAANPTDTKYESLGLFVPGAYFDGTFFLTQSFHTTQANRRKLLAKT